MARRLPEVDVVIVGLGWTGSILAKELTDAGLRVVAVERGPWRDAATDFPTTYAQDELRYRIRHDLFLRPAQDTLTFRNKAGQTALPVRTWGAFMLPNGVGGGGTHWNAETWRFLPSDFVLRSHLTGRYGARAIPEHMTIQDWGVTFAELEPHYARFEQVCGTSGTAGNLGGARQPGGNPFEGPRSNPYPTPAQQQPYAAALFADAARDMGYHPFPQPSGNLSRPYANPYGVEMGPCTFCGFCEWFGCGNYSKSSPQACILPALVLSENFEARTECEVTRVNLDGTGKRATGVTYVDAAGEEWEQPAGIVLLCAFQMFNVQLLLHSGIGTPYDPATGEGTVGRNYSYQTWSTVTGLFPGRNFNPFVSSGAIGMCIDEFNGDNFDHGGLGFLGGGYMGANMTNGRPLQSMLRVPEGTPAWGAQWKKAVAENYLSSYEFNQHGSCCSYRTNHLDLDPTYKDRFGRPLLRLTFDFDDNERRMAAYLTDRMAEIVGRMGAKEVQKKPMHGTYDITKYQTSHTCGGAVMGTDPRSSVVNRYMQSWDVPNLFVLGASAFPQNAGYNPTGTVGALAYWTAEAIRTRYVKSPGPLVPA